jgi:GNAT superfamily N-acetyltransferase
MPIVDVVFEESSPASAEGRALMAALDLELLERYPGESVHGLAEEEIEHFAGVFLLARQIEPPAPGRVIGCGALRPIDTETAEVKRMYVIEEARGRGVATQILERLEASAVAMGYGRIRLETGEAQPEAIRLYEKAGYRRIPCYGEYVDDPRSLCFEKELRPVTGS